MNEILRLDDLKERLKDEFADGNVKIYVAIRQPDFDEDHLIDLMEVSSASGMTMRLNSICGLTSSKERTGIQHEASKSGERKDYSKDDLARAWFGALRSVLTCLGFPSLKADPIHLGSVLSDQRRLRLFCDTNTIAGGTATWLMESRWRQVDFVVSSIVEREMHAWPDRSSSFWLGDTAEAFQYRAQYKLGRRFLERPPVDVGVTRMLAKEQSALVLAKNADSRGTKSPDADVLIVEHAREFLRDQGAGARMIFVTGDLATARVAMNSVGAENVMYIVSDTKQTQEHAGKATPLGWWRPGGVYGAVRQIDLSEIVDVLLCPFQLVVIKNAQKSVFIKDFHNVPNGSPSDWVSPRVEIEVRRHGSETTPAEDSIEAKSLSDNLDEPPASETVKSNADERRENALSSVQGIFDSPSAFSSSAGSDLRPNTVLLLDPQVSGSAIVASQRRLTAKATLYVMAEARHVPHPFSAKPSDELIKEAAGILRDLNAFKVSGDSVELSEEWASRWDDNNLDWFHRQFLRHPSYAKAMRSLRAGSSASLDKRSSANVSLIRVLGQAIYNRRQGSLGGDAGLSVLELTQFIKSLVPNKGDSVSVEELTSRALADLKITPYRLEVALRELWSQSPQYPIAPAAGGVVLGNSFEEVAMMSSTSLQIQPVYATALSFGTDKAFRFLVNER